MLYDRGGNIGGLPKHMGYYLSSQPVSAFRHNMTVQCHLHHGFKTKKEVDGKFERRFSNLETLYHASVSDDISGLAYSTVRQEQIGPLNTGDWKRQKNNPSWKA